MEMFGIEVDKIWILAGVLIAFTELLFPAMVSIWSGLAAVIVGLMVCFGLISPESYKWQFLWFFSLTIFLLLFWFFYLKRRFSSYANDTRDSSLLNLKGVALTKIEKGKPGEVELYQHYHGIKKWKADSDVTIEPGDIIEVFEASGIKLRVKKF